MSDKATLTLTALFITFGALANLVRFFWNISVTIGSFVLPGWTGALFYIGLGLLAAWSFRAVGALYPHSPENISNP